MKIGIITQPLRVNYGGILQNFALQQILKNLGHEPVTIDSNEDLSCKRDILWPLRIIKRLILKLSGDSTIIYIDPRKHSIAMTNPATHLNFIKKYINVVTVKYPISEQITSNEGIDGYIVGSDQVWRPLYNSNLGNCYLDFAEHQKVKRIAYAASFGLNNWNEYTPELTEKCSRLAKLFDAISVREQTAINLCKEHLGVQALHVLDPTMLLSASEYKKLLSRKDYIYDGEVLVYVLDMTPQKKQIIEEICSKLNKRAYYIGKFEKGKFPSIESWIAGFDVAEFVITDSFHGTVFSIIFGKQFITIGNMNRGLTRIISLFTTFKIDQNRIISKDALTINLDKDRIDYDHVNEILENRKNLSLEFIKKNIK